MLLVLTPSTAVVSLLKKVGASNRLTYMIIGEALINDGTALVLYNLLYALIANDPDISVTPVNIFVYFLIVVIASPLLGAAFGGIAVVFMSITNRRLKEEDNTIQMAITLTCAYVSFYVAEYVCGISGVISCCSAATVLARFAIPLILKPETLHSIWAAIEWVGNTVIFFIAGIIICLRSFTFITGRDVGFMLLTYIGIFVIRFGTMGLFYPALKTLGKGCTPAEAVFISWGGLRGAVSLALALSLVESAEKGDASISLHDAHRVLFMVGGTAALTLMLNATTAGWVLQKLDLLVASDNEEGKIMFYYVKKTIRLKSYKLLEQFQGEHPDLIDPDFVISACSIMKDLDDHSSSQESPLASPATSPMAHQTTTSRPFAEKDIEMNTMTVSAMHDGSNGDEEEGKLDDTPSPPPSPSRALDGSPSKPDLTRRVLRKANRKSITVSKESDEYSHDLTDTISNIVSARARGRSIYDDNRRQHRTMSLRMQKEDLEKLTVAMAAVPALEERKDDIRRAFLNVVRVNYWHQINSGRLNRKSVVALTLLSSIDIALEAALPGLQDWQYILKVKAEIFRDVLLAYQSTHVTLNDVDGGSKNFEAMLAADPNEPSVSPALSTTSISTTATAATTISKKEEFERDLRAYHSSQAVYLLTSFIEAQRYAQKKIPSYLGEGLSKTPEAVLVIRESHDQMDHAMRLLQHIHPRIARRQLSKLAVRWILHMAEDSVETFQKEGVITEEQAEALLDEVSHNLHEARQDVWYRFAYFRIVKMIYDIMDCCVKKADNKAM